MSFFEELKRRNVFRVGIAYALLGWVVLQGADFALDLVDAPNWIIQVLFIIGLVGLPFALFFAWAFEVTPEGIKREAEVDRSRSITSTTGRKLDRAIIVFLALAVVLLLADRYWRPPGQAVETLNGVETAAQPGSSAPGDAIDDEASPADRSLAVLPFVAMSSGPDDEFFADGLTEEILNSLAQLPELLVTARTSAFAFKGQELPVGEIAAKLGVKHVVEGSVRRSGDRIRVTAQLIRAEDGFHLWSQNYDATAEDTISVQENIAEEIAVALDVVLDDSKRRAMQLAGLRNVEAFTRYQEARHWYEAAHGEMRTIDGLRKANELFEEVIELVPDFPQAYVDHSDLYAHFILDDFAGFPMEDVSREEIDSAAANAIRDYDMAIRYAKSDRERHSYEFDRAFLSGEWQGITGRIALLLNSEGCINNNWIAQMADIYGYAAEHARFAHEIRLCDPLVSLEWFVESRALFWAGELERSLEVAQMGAEVAPGSWLNYQTVDTLVALGRFEEAERLVITRMRSPAEAALGRMTIAAARGDRDELARQYALYNDAEGSRMWSLIYFAWSGQQDRADAIAAELDRNPNNHFGFTVVTAWCACGAPFDLDVTPNFAAKLENSGLSWPPPRPIDFPLQAGQ